MFMQIKLEIDASEYNGFLNLEVFDKNKKLSVIPKFVTGYNSLINILLVLFKDRSLSFMPLGV